MEYTGIFVKYPVNRPLTEQERAQQLKQGQRLNVDPLYQLSVIKMNSTYLESVDKWFGWKGVVTALSLAFMAIFVGMFGWGALDWLLQGIGVVPTEQDRGEMLAAGAGMLVGVGLVTWALTWILRKDSFAFTHYPMRFDRKARMVHVFRPNGTTLSVPWDKVFFTIGSLPRWREWEVRGHVLNSDGVTVEETFPLSYIGTFDPSSESFDPQRVAPDDYLRAHWEFIRRYMEEGPQAVTGQVQFCMPISNKKETFANGIERVCANIAHAPVLGYWIFWPFCMLVGVARRFAMVTGKIPQFPPKIEASSVIEIDDPYAIEGAPNGDRVAVYPAAANAAGVRFTGMPRRT